MATNKTETNNLKPSQRQINKEIRQKEFNKQWNRYKRSVKRLNSFGFNTEMMDKKSLISSINNKKSFTSVTNKLQREIKKSYGFRETKAGVKYTPLSVTNKYGIKISRRDYNKALENTRIANKLRMREMKRLAPEHYKKFYSKNPTHSKMDLMSYGDEKFSRFRPQKFNINTIPDKGRLEKRLKHIKSTTTKKYFKATDKRMKSNYKSVILETFGSSYGNQLINLINKLTLDQFLITYYKEDIGFSFLYKFDELMAKYEQLKTIFTYYIEKFKKE